jgi:hypothetical protein
MKTRTPKVVYRFLSTDLETEVYTEVSFDTAEEAEAWAAALRRAGAEVSVQIDQFNGLTVDQKEVRA